MANSGHITRTSLSLSNLAIATATYDVMVDEGSLLDVGSVTWRRLTADSPYVNGRVLMAAVKDTPTMAVRIDVIGTDLADVQTKVGTLLTAVWQPSYQLSLTFDSATYTWDCEPADASVGVNYAHLFGLACPVGLAIPRKPTPAAGPV